MGLSPSRPSHFDLIIEADRLIREAGEYEKAIETYSNALELSPDYWLTYYKRSQAYLHVGHLALARIDAEAAVKLEKGVMTRKLMRTVLERSGDTEGAARESERIAHLEKREAARRKKQAEDEEKREWADKDSQLKDLQHLQRSEFAKQLRKHRERCGSNAERSLSRQQMPVPVHPDRAAAHRAAAAAPRNLEGDSVPLIVR